MTDDQLYQAIQADPVAKSLADSGNDFACAARISATLPPIQGSVSANQMLVWGAKTGVRKAIEDKIGDPTFGAICLAVRDLLSFGGTFDTASPDNRNMIVALQAGGIMTAAQGASLLALGQVSPIISADEVSRAMLPHRANGRIS